MPVGEGAGGGEQYACKLRGCIYRLQKNSSCVKTCIRTRVYACRKSLKNNNTLAVAGMRVAKRSAIENPFLQFLYKYGALSSPQPMESIYAPHFTGVGRKEDGKQKQQRNVVELIGDVVPHWPLAAAVPGRQREDEHLQHADN